MSNIDSSSSQISLRPFRKIVVKSEILSNKFVRISNVIDGKNHGLILISDRAIYSIDTLFKNVKILYKSDYLKNIVSANLVFDKYLLIVSEFSNNVKNDNSLKLELVDILSGIHVDSINMLDMHGIRRFLRVNGENCLTSGLYENLTFLSSRSNSVIYKISFLKLKDSYEEIRMEIDTLKLDLIWNQLPFEKSDSLLNTSIERSINDIKSYSQLIRDYSSIKSINIISEKDILVKTQCERNNCHSNIYIYDFVNREISTVCKIKDLDVYERNESRETEEFDYSSLLKYSSIPFIYGKCGWWLVKMYLEEQQLVLNYSKVK
jgi:hypothetical protein